MKTNYTKADLEELVYSQLEGLNALHDLVISLSHQNKLMKMYNEKLIKEIGEFKIEKFPLAKRNKKG